MFRRSVSKQISFRDRWVLVTGASSGLGEEIARQLAEKHGAHLVLVARRKERLDALAQELQERFGVSAISLPADLSNDADVEKVFTESTNGRAIHGVILNAGVTHFGRSLNLPWADFQSMLATNVVSLTRLAKLFVPYLQERLNSQAKPSHQANGGGLMLVSSLAGLIPLPFQTDYSAMKAYITSFGQGLAHETKGSGISVTVFSPGGIATEMLDKSGTSRVAKPGDVGIMPVQDCAEHAIRAFQQREYVYIPGVVNRASVLASRVLPRRFFVGQVANVYRKGLTD